MAKSLKSELREIARLEEKTKRDMERLQARREKLKGPLAGKLSSIFAERLSAFLDEHLEEAAEVRLDKAAISGEMDVMLSRIFLAPPAAEEETGNGADSGA